jgi:hypothetical protein
MVVIYGQHTQLKGMPSKGSIKCAVGKKSGHTMEKAALQFDPFLVAKREPL